jgi:regulator of RNase E activity RraB
MKELQRALLPDDETGEVLRAMLDDGDDLTRPREIAFYLVFAEATQAEAFAAQAAELSDLEVEAPEVDEEGIWQVVATRRMSASHAGITGLEQLLATLAQPHGGHPDGWSCDPADAAG